MTFFETIHCTSRVHCRTCRDREGGQAWRRAILRMFPLPDPVIADKYFDCPAGLPWLTSETSGEFVDALKLLPVAKAPPSLAQRRIEAHCRTCDNYQNHRCLLYRGGHCSPCEFAAYLNRLGAMCPGDGGKWHKTA
ncbi:MAG: hypothetical protein HZA50_14775 [Planctomycetes bacterium]|nr:hypothetical protein [Planctomycetota bacterium]